METSDMVSIPVDYPSNSVETPLLSTTQSTDLFITDTKDILLDAVLNNRSTDIEAIINRLDDSIIEFIYKDYNKTILIIACTEKTVNEDTLEVLYRSMESAYGEIRYVNNFFFGWEPIHYLAEIADPKKLEKVIDHIYDVNSLSYFSENALHVLLQYGSSRSTINIELNYRNNSNSKVCTILDKEKDNIPQCAGLLIQKGVDVNQTNIWNETPICLAIGNVYPRVIQQLLKVNINLDNFIGDVTVRDYLRRNDMLCNMINNVQETPVSKLFTYLKSGKEDWFLQYNDGNISDHVDGIEGEDDRGGTMLQMCLTKGFFEYLKDESYDKELRNVDIEDSPMLRIFNSKGLKRSILHLLDNSADTSKTTKKFNISPLEYAAIRGYYPFVAILLQHGRSKISYDDIFTTLSKLFSNKINLKNHEHYEKCVLYLLLNKLISIEYHEHQAEDSTDNSQDDVGHNRLTGKKSNILNTLLSKLNLELDDEKNDDSELICQLLHLGATLTEPVLRKKINSGESPENGIIGKFLQVFTKSSEEADKLVIEIIHPNILRSHVNDCVRNKRFIYDTIIEDSKNYSETTTIHILSRIEEEKKDILVHPLFIYFLHEKWTRVSWVYYLNLLFYSAFLISIFVYMICLGEGIVNYFTSISFYTLLIYHILKEIFQVLLFHWKYLQDKSNHFEIVLIVSCVSSIFFPNIISMVIAIITATLIFLLMWGQLFTKYTIIFGCSKYFIEYVLFYFVQFISFAICFQIVFPFEQTKSDENSSPNNSTNTTTYENCSPNNSTDTKTTEEIIGDLFKNVFYTIIHFTGEFNERVLEPKKHPIFGRVITTVFIFCMTIILNNLLVGSIVADMDKIQKSGKLYKQVEMATFIQRINTFIDFLHKFKASDRIKKVIDRIKINIFKRNRKKTMNFDNATFFDKDDRKYLNSIKNQHAFDKNVLRDVYDIISK